MTRARKELISLEDTPYYHCVSRCVRRAFLCGKDQWSGQSFEHRREWVVERLKLMVKVYCIEICSYAVMSNHWHVVLKVDSDKAKNLSNEEVLSRWRQLYAGNVLVNRYVRGDNLTVAEVDAVDEVIDVWRERLTDISWFMRGVNESIARDANAEDGCTGRFWEGRFKSQALLDEAAILAAMVYVDLNPVRARLADTPEESEFTSIRERILHHGKSCSLASFDGAEKRDKERSIPFEWFEYLTLVDWTGRAVDPKKRGHIESRAPSIVTRLGFDEEAWMLGLSGPTFKWQKSVSIGSFIKEDKYVA